LIVGPATDSKGKPVASQFVMNVVLKVLPRDQGKYDASFAYFSSTPVPYGSWYWVHINGHRLALASRDGFSRNQHLYFERERLNGYRPMNAPRMQNLPTPAFRSPPRNVAPPPSRPQGH
jgi:hypothetical protein